MQLSAFAAFAVWLYQFEPTGLPPDLNINAVWQLACFAENWRIHRLFNEATDVIMARTALPSCSTVNQVWEAGLPHSLLRDLLVKRVIAGSQVLRDYTGAEPNERCALVTDQLHDIFGQFPSLEVACLETLFFQPRYDHHSPCKASEAEQADRAWWHPIESSVKRLSPKPSILTSVVVRFRYLGIQLTLDWAPGPGMRHHNVNEDIFGMQHQEITLSSTPSSVASARRRVTNGLLTPSANTGTHAADSEQGNEVSRVSESDLSPPPNSGSTATSDVPISEQSTEIASSSSSELTQPSSSPSAPSSAGGAGAAGAAGLAGAAEPAAGAAAPAAPAAGGPSSPSRRRPRVSSVPSTPVAAGPSQTRHSPKRQRTSPTRPRATPPHRRLSLINSRRVFPGWSVITGQASQQLPGDGSTDASGSGEGSDTGVSSTSRVSSAEPSATQATTSGSQPNGPPSAQPAPHASGSLSYQSPYNLRSRARSNTGPNPADN
ncbi:hypothetical protein KEM52_005456 [Ascosphaera acerosa]|nr:hypothetical protein KEM52_005456 [Ascosphaera acerosa]